jgi:hypothetical protein
MQDLEFFKEKYGEDVRKLPVFGRLKQSTGDCLQTGPEASQVRLFSFGRRNSQSIETLTKDSPETDRRVQAEELGVRGQKVVGRTSVKAPNETAFSFGVQPEKMIFKHLNIYVDINCEDPTYPDEIEEMCEAHGAVIQNRIRYSDASKKSMTSIVIWRKGSYKTIQLAQEHVIPLVTEKWIMKSIQAKVKLPYDLFLLSDYDREEAKKREELGIKVNRRVRRRKVGSSKKSREGEEGVQERQNERLRLFDKLDDDIRKKDMKGLLNDMADHLKGLCGDTQGASSDLEESQRPQEGLMGRDIAGRRGRGVEGEGAKVRRGKGAEKTVKMNREEAVGLKEGGQSNGNVLHAMLFNKQKETSILVLYQGSFNVIQPLKAEVVSERNLVLIPSDKFPLYWKKIDLFFFDEKSQATLGFIYCYMKKVVMVSTCWLYYCRAFKALFVTAETIPKEVLPAVTLVANSLAHTKIMIFRNEGNKSAELQFKQRFMEEAVVQFGGSVAERQSEADYFVLASEDCELAPNKRKLGINASYSHYVVKEDWLVQSIVKGEKQHSRDYLFFKG